MSSRIPAFVNPASPNADAARAALIASGHFELHELAPYRLRAQIEEAVANGAARVLVAGGDGTLGTAAAALLGGSAELAVLPAGTLNHFAKDHAIPETLEEAIAAALGSTIDRVDVGVVSDRVFLNTASVGMYVTYVRARLEVQRFFGYRIGSFLALLRTFFRPGRLAVEVELEGVTKRYRTPLVFVGVGERELKAPKFGGRVAGGRRGLHVIVVRGRHPARLLALGLAAARRGVKDVAATPDVDSFIVETCRVHVGRRRSVTMGMDGEIIRVPAPLEFRIKYDALRVVGASPPADAPPEAA